MRVHSLRFDIWFCLLISFLVSYIPVKIIEKNFSKKYDSYVEDHTVKDDEIGGIASDTIFRAQNVDDLLTHDTFTIVSDGIEYRNRGAGYYGNYYMYAVTLPSGELIAAKINGDSVVSTGEDLFSGDNILPVGKIVYEDLKKNETFLSQIEYKEPLTRTDFYIDMLGSGGKVSKEDYIEFPSLIAQLLTILIIFPLTHMLGSKLGIFPSFFSLKKQNKSEWK